MEKLWTETDAMDAKPSVILRSEHETKTRGFEHNLEIKSNKAWFYAKTSAWMLFEQNIC